MFENGFIFKLISETGLKCLVTINRVQFEIYSAAVLLSHVLRGPHTGVAIGGP